MISKNINLNILFESSLDLLLISSAFLGFLSTWIFLLHQIEKANKRPGINIKDL
jgi:hypothetical protein